MQNTHHRISRAGLIAGGIAALLTALTTLLLWWLPQTYSVSPGFEGSLELHLQTAYMARLWVNYVHVFLAFGAYLAVAAVLWSRAPALAATGIAAFLIWCIAEALGVSINIWAVNESWRAGYASATEAEQLLIRGSLHSIAGIWDGIFFVILCAFLIATTCFGVALTSGTRLEQSLAALYLLAAPLTAVIIVDSYFGIALTTWISWSYPLLQPVSRALTGVWLIRCAWRRISAEQQLGQGAQDFLQRPRAPHIG